jgi:S1-C subfamily serine protease
VGAEGLGFATPVDIARSVAEDIITQGRAVHVWLGVEGTDLDRRSAEELEVRGGARVDQVVEGSPAADAGVTRQDVIVGVGGQPVGSMSALVIALRDSDPGDEVVLDVRRDGDRRRVVVELVERRG